METCNIQPVYNYILGIALCIGGMVTYIPQYISILKHKNINGISELSLFILNLSSTLLTLNSIILNWSLFQCYNNCNGWLCTGNLLPLFQIACGALVVIPLYIIFLYFKVNQSDKSYLHDLRFALTYLFSIIVLSIIVPLIRSSHGIIIFAKIIGVFAAIFSCIIWVPQIVKLIKTKDPGKLSLVMFLFQTPGNAIIIVLQLLYKQDWSTWITYLFLFIEQTAIVFLIIFYKKRMMSQYNRELTESLLDEEYSIFDDEEN